MAATERGTSLPAHLLQAIGIVESGRIVPQSGSAAPWPWTIDIAGTGYFFDTKAEAIAAVVAAQASGIRSIDVGCMQINLQYHPLAFAGLDDAFDPAANVRYGAAFLQRLRAATGNWAAAIAAYHSATPDLGQTYTQRVAAIWPLAAAYALPLRTVGVAAASVAPTAKPLQDVDPEHVATPEFRARLLQEAAFRRERDRAMGLPTADGADARPARRPVARLYADAGRFNSARVRR